MKPIGLLVIAAALPTLAATHLVDVNSTNPVAPYTNWTTAATVIQDAVDAASPGDTVLVTNGVYATGGKAVTGSMTNRVAVTKPLTLLSVNGPEFTLIRGHQLPGFTVGNGAVRCVYLTNGAFLSGFTLTNGATRTSGDPTRERCGAGLWCESATAWASNCVFAGNGANLEGGGVYGGSLFQCTLSRNSAADGGGACFSSLRGCLVTECTAVNLGGGAANCVMNNCTVVGNGGIGVFATALNNSIIYFNYYGTWVENTARSFLTNCCTFPLASGPGGITNAPIFVGTNGWADLRLQSNSPCINAGNNAFVTTTNDLDGNPRIVGGTVDMGAYEFQSPQSIISYAWLQQYGLPTDGSADDSDSDSDSHTAWQEWKAWTDPTNESSVLRMLNPQPGTNGTLVTWESVAGQSYQIERSTDANAPFSALYRDIVGETGTTSILDTTATNGDIFLYRVGVQ